MINPGFNVVSPFGAPTRYEGGVDFVPALYVTPYDTSPWSYTDPAVDARNIRKHRVVLMYPKDDGSVDFVALRHEQLQGNLGGQFFSQVPPNDRYASVPTKRYGYINYNYVQGGVGPLVVRMNGCGGVVFSETLPVTHGSPLTYPTYQAVGAYAVELGGRAYVMVARYIVECTTAPNSLPYGTTNGTYTREAITAIEVEYDSSSGMYSAVQQLDLINRIVGSSIDGNSLVAGEYKEYRGEIDGVYVLSAAIQRTHMSAPPSVLSRYVLVMAGDELSMVEEIINHDLQGTATTGLVSGASTANYNYHSVSTNWGNCSGDNENNGSSGSVTASETSSSSRSSGTTYRTVVSPTHGSELVVESIGASSFSHSINDVDGDVTRSDTSPASAGSVSALGETYAKSVGSYSFTFNCDSAGQFTRGPSSDVYMLGVSIDVGTVAMQQERAGYTHNRSDSSGLLPIEDCPFTNYLVVRDGDGFTRVQIPKPDGYYSDTYKFYGNSPSYCYDGPGWIEFPASMCTTSSTLTGTTCDSSPTYSYTVVTDKTCTSTASGGSPMTKYGPTMCLTVGTGSISSPCGTQLLTNGGVMDIGSYAKVVHTVWAASGYPSGSLGATQVYAGGVFTDIADILSDMVVGYPSVIEYQDIALWLKGRCVSMVIGVPSRVYRKMRPE